VISFKGFKSQVVSNKNTLVFQSELEIVHENALFDETRPILDYNSAKAAGQKLNPAYESHTVIRFKKDENDDYNIDDIDLSSGQKKYEKKSTYKGKAGDSFEDFTPVKALNAMNSDWRIKVRCTKLYPLRTYKNDKGDGKIQSIELMDAYGGMIEATIFNADVDKFLPMLREGGVYILNNGLVKVANQKFAKVKNDYCLNFTSQTNLREVEDDLNISKRGFSTTSLAKIFSLMPPPS
jgi:replication factor A1